jgi:hypothetical protein
MYRDNTPNHALLGVQQILADKSIPVMTTITLSGSRSR